MPVVRGVVRRAPEVDARRRARLVLPCAVAVLALAFPAGLVLAGPLRSNGSPVRLLGFLALALVILGWSARRYGRAVRLNPAVVAALVFLVAALVSFGLAYTRVLSAEETASTLRTLLAYSAGAGLTLYIATMVRTLDEVLTVVRFLVVAATFSAVVGIIQSRASLDLAAYLRPPGFVTNVERPVGERSNFVRVIGAAGHPIEFTVVMGAVAPLALHLARFSSSRRARVRWGVAFALVAAAVPFGVARSGVVAIAVAMLAYSLVWTWRQRATALAVTVVALGLFRAVVPGLIGTLRSLFLNANDDPSVQGRQADYSTLAGYFAERPFFGRGLGTFVPTEYLFVDNQWFMTGVESGVLGLVTLAGLFLAGVFSARGAAHRDPSPEVRSLGMALVGALLAVAAAAYTFDLFSFQQTLVLLFILLGLAASLRNHAIAVSGIATLRGRLHAPNKWGFYGGIRQ